MKIDLMNTTSSRINAALISARRAGGAAPGMVLTLVIVTDEGSAYDALKAANDASHEHPSRILVVIKRADRSPRVHTGSRLDAEIMVGSDAGSGETAVLRTYGELNAHAESVVLPLLLPDAPVVVWWPDNAPQHPAQDPIGALGQRRITDSSAADAPVEQLAQRAADYTPGDTDLAWTRITGWRSMLAAALDQTRAAVSSAEVRSEPADPGAELLAQWLSHRLRIPVRSVAEDGSGITEVRLRTGDAGDIVISDPNGSTATLSVPGRPERTVSLKTGSVADLLCEELRRLDPDEIYAAALQSGRQPDE